MLFEYGNVRKFVQLNSVNVNAGHLSRVSFPGSADHLPVLSPHYLLVATPLLVMRLLSLIFPACRFSCFPLLSSNRQFKLPNYLKPNISF